MRTNPRSTSPRRRTAALEPLEPRRLMSVTLDHATHLLTVDGTNAGDALTVTMEGGKVKVNDNGVVHLFDKANVSKLFLRGFGGKDVLKLTQSVTIPATLWGGLDNDILRGGGGDDSLNGGGGDDNLEGGNGADDINGASGVDTADYGTRLTTVLVSLDNVPNDGYGDYDDAVETSIYAGSTPHSAEGDNVHTDVENVSGGKGRDYLTGSDGTRGGDGGNVIHGNGGDDYVGGAGGYDTLYGDDGNDVLDEGGASEYRYNYEPQGDTMYGGPGDDYFYGDGGNDVMYGEAGDDDFWAWGGDDTLWGGADDDTLHGQAGADDMHGGTGVDTVDYSYISSAFTPLGVVVTLDDVANDGKFFFFSEADNAHSDVENVIGTENADSITGNGGNNRLDGGAGNDEIRGGGGVDYLFGGDGDDRLYAKDGIFGEYVIGGAGTDTAWTDFLTSTKKDVTLAVEVVNH